MNRLILFSALLALTLVIVAAVPSEGGTGTVAATSYCVSGPGGTQPVPAELFFQGGSVILTPEISAILIDNAEGVFYVGFQQGTNSVMVLFGFLNPLQFLAPGWSGPYVVVEGACPVTGAAPAVADRGFWLCFSKSRNPGYFSRGDAVQNYAAGMTVPYAVKRTVSDTNIGNGYFLTCVIPSGYRLGDLAVSTGGGEEYAGAVGAGLLFTNPLDFTRNLIPV